MENRSASVCEIVAETKLRNGYFNWWCKTHFAPARGERGQKLEKCLKADAIPVAETDKIFIDLDDYPGGVGIWGSLEAVYDSKREVSEKGVHVHLRKTAGGEKTVDRTFKEVYIKIPSNEVFENDNWVKIDENIACAYTSSIVFDKKLKILKCKHCHKEHIDEEYFAVHYHKKHLCTYCGRDFIDTEHGISNPVFLIQDVFKEKLKNRKVSKVDRKLVISQKDYPGGIQIWGSNPAIIWTADRFEEGGIHVHLFKNKNGLPVSDDTYGFVEIDGIELDDEMIRYYMVQKSLPYLRKYLTSEKCPSCYQDHFDKFDKALNPHKIHDCEHCGKTFEDKTRFKGTVSNPILNRLQVLSDINT